MDTIKRMMLLVVRAHDWSDRITGSTRSVICGSIIKQKTANTQGAQPCCSKCGYTHQTLWPCQSKIMHCLVIAQHKLQIHGSISALRVYNECPHMPYVIRNETADIIH